VKDNVSVAGATTNEVVLPERVQEALGQLVGAAKEGLLALSVEVGLGVPRERLEQEVEEIVGPKGTHNPGPQRGSSRSRGWRGDARWPSCRGPPAAGPHGGWRARGATADL
jgi:hypothetical protein